MERLEDRILTVAKQDQVLRLERDQLTTELGADRSARSGHEDRATGSQTTHRVQVSLDGISAQQVFDLDFAERSHAHATAKNLEEPRYRAGAKTGLVRGAHHLAHHGAGRAWHRDDQLLNMFSVGDLTDLLERSHHLQVAEAQAELGVIVVDEPDGRQSELRVRVNFFDDHLARGARAGNQYSPVTVRRPALGVSLARDSQEEPRRRNYCDAENRIHREHGDRHSHSRYSR